MARTAAVMVLDHVPSDEELEDMAYAHLDDLESEDAVATCDIVYEAPEWLDVAARDQVNAHMRDGSACILVIYMSDEADDYEDEEEC